MCQIEYKGKIHQFYPYDMTLNEILRPQFQKLFIEQNGYPAFLQLCYACVIGDPSDLNEQQYEYYLHEQYDDYPIF